MKVSEYVVTHKEGDVIVANLFDYYDRFVVFLNPSKFGKYSFYRNKLVRCLFIDHEDPNPSFGWMKDRKREGVKLYHCFGCGKTGDIVDLHQILLNQYFGRKLSREDAAEDLANVMGVDLELYKVEETERKKNIQDYDDLKMHENLTVTRLQESYSIEKYRKALLNMRSTGKINLTAVNREIIKLIATQKGMYE